MFGPGAQVNRIEELNDRLDLLMEAFRRSKSPGMKKTWKRKACELSKVREELCQVKGEFPLGEL
jgi:hypothetical protein